MRFLVCGAVTGIALVVAGAARGADWGTGLVGYWKLDETGIGAATVAVDSSATRANGVYVNTPTSDSAVPPVAYPDPSSVLVSRDAMQAVKVQAVPAALKPPAVTVAAWFRVRNTVSNSGSGQGYSDIVSIGDQALIRVYRDQVETSKRVAGNAWVALRQGATLGNGVWHHLAGTLDGTAMTLYFDGAAVATMADARPIAYDLGPDLWIGRHGSGTMGRDFDGNIDEVAIWARVLSAAEIMAVATGQQPGTGGVVPPVDAGVPPPADAGPPPPADAGPPPPADAGSPPPADAGVPPPPDPGATDAGSVPPPDDDARALDAGVMSGDAPGLQPDTRPPGPDAAPPGDDAAVAEDVAGSAEDAPPSTAADAAALPADGGDAVAPGTDGASRLHDGGSRPPAPSSGCGCATAPGAPDTSGLAALLLAGLAGLVLLARALRRARRP